MVRSGTLRHARGILKVLTRVLGGVFTGLNSPTEPLIYELFVGCPSLIDELGRESIILNPIQDCIPAMFRVFLDMLNPSEPS